jgi:RNA polymerase sigma-70 factor (ECF subfamily)
MPLLSSFSDNELLLLLKEGNKGAFEEIYFRYDKPLYLYAYHKLGNKEEARDVVHDVFAWMLHNKDQLGLKTTLSGYLYKSVLNKIFNIFKHKQIILKHINSGEHYIDVESKETDYLIREKDIAAMIEKEIAAMPPKMREIYELKTKAHLTTKQIAKQLGVAESTVITQSKRAMKHLKAKLGIIIYLLFIANL